jgi:toxin FitB
VIVVDTNVLSELMRPEPAAPVRRWTDRQSLVSLYTTSVTQAEILRGIALLPLGKRREALLEKADVLFERLFDRRILSFDSDAARAYASIAAERERSGRPLSTFDGQIVAIARVNGADVATRNVDDFEHCGVELIDPWHA